MRKRERGGKTRRKKIEKRESATQIHEKKKQTSKNNKNNKNNKKNKKKTKQKKKQKTKQKQKKIIPGGHQVLVVNSLDKGLDARALGNLPAAHSPGNSQRVTVNSDNQSVTVLLLVGSVVVGLNDDALAAGETTLEDNHHLTGFQAVGEERGGERERERGGEKRGEKGREEEVWEEGEWWWGFC